MCLADGRLSFPNLLKPENININGNMVTLWPLYHCTIYYWWRNVCVHCKTPEAVLTHPSIHMKTTFADVEPNPAIVCVVGPAAVVTFPFNSRQAVVGGAVLAPGGGFLARAPCPSYNPNPNTSFEFPLWVSLAWYFVHWTPGDLAKSQALYKIWNLENIQVSCSCL